METVIVALISGGVTLAGALASNSRSRAVMEQKVDELTRRVEEHNCPAERACLLERDVALLKNDVEGLERKAGHDEWALGGQRAALAAGEGRYPGRARHRGGEPGPAGGREGPGARGRAPVVALAMAALPPVMAEVGKHAGGSDATEGGDAE